MSVQSLSVRGRACLIGRMACRIINGGIIVQAWFRFLFADLPLCLWARKVYLVIPWDAIMGIVALQDGV